MSGRPDLHVIPGGGDLALATARDDVLDPFAYQARCVGSWVMSMVARGFSTTTIEGDNATLDRFLALAGKPVWELTAAKNLSKVALSPTIVVELKPRATML